MIFYTWRQSLTSGLRLVNKWVQRQGDRVVMTVFDVAPVTFLINPIYTVHKYTPLAVAVITLIFLPVSWVDRFGSSAVPL